MTVSKLRRRPSPPTHLSAARRTLWRQIIESASFTFEPWHLTQLEVLCTALDRAAGARVILAKQGLYLAKANGDPVAHPMVAAERESQRTALRALAALDLDADLPAARPGHKLAGGVFR